MAEIRTTYLGYTIYVGHKGYVVHDADGQPVGEVYSIGSARALVKRLRREKKGQAA